MPAAKLSRQALFAWGTLGLFGLTVLTQANRQLLSRGATLDAARKSNRYIVEREEIPRRGSIETADNTVLAITEESYELSLNLARIPHIHSFFSQLAAVAGISGAEIAAAVDRGKKNLFWTTKLSADQASSIKSLKRDWKADGISLTRTSKRVYPMGQTVANLVGTFDEDGAAGGLEKSLESNLKGAPGKSVGLVDRSGNFLPMRLLDGTTPKQDGSSVTLTLRASLQSAATRALKSAVEANSATSGSAVVMDPSTGDVLAIASWPSAEPTPGKKIQGYSPAYSTVYEPGSTFKILSLANALDQGKVELQDSIDCGGEWWFTNKYRVRCDEHHGSRAQGTIDCSKAISKSCNIYAAKWALSTGRKEYLHYLDSLGLFHRTELPIDKEVPGLINRKDPAPLLQLSRMGFGQAISCTPLGLASAFIMLGNNGVRMQPRLIKAVDGKEIAPKAMGRIVKPQVAQEVLDVMVSVISSDEGTGAKLRIPGYEIAGKTGTAEKVGGGEEGHVSNFVGFVPAKSPKAMILVMIDNPHVANYYGAAVAGPAFRSIAKEVIRTFKIRPTVSTLEAGKIGSN